MQRVIRKYPEADFSSISQFRTRNSLAWQVEKIRASGKKKKKEDATEAKAGCQADFSSISQFRTRNSLAWQVEKVKASGKKKQEDAAEAMKAGCLAHSDNRFPGLIMARQVPKTRSSAKRTAAEMATGFEKAGFNAVLSHHKQTVLKTIVSLTCRM